MTPYFLARSGSGAMTVNLTEAEMDLILTGLDLGGDQAQHDAEFGGSDEPEVARKIAKEFGDLLAKIKRLQR